MSNENIEMNVIYVEVLTYKLSDGLYRVVFKYNDKERSILYAHEPKTYEVERAMHQLIEREMRT